MGELVLENGTSDSYLFDTAVLDRVDWQSRKAFFKGSVSPSNVGESLVLRPLCASDYDKSFMSLLGQLTKVGEVTKEMFLAQFQAMKQCADTYYIIVVEDTQTGQVIGSGTLVVERKFIHSTSTRGRIEDIVINSDYRGKQLGKLLVETLTLLGKHLGCYKMSLECRDDKVPFYQSSGYVKEGGQNFMVLRYHD